MVAAAFLWGVFVLACVWNLSAWQFVFDNDPNAPDNKPRHSIKLGAIWHSLVRLRILFVRRGSSHFRGSGMRLRK